LNTWLDTGRRAALLACGCTLVLLNGCAEVTFKRGAGPGEMQATEQACRAQSADVEAYKACLNAAGFVYAKPSGDAVLFAEQAQVGDGIAVTHAAPTISVAAAGRAGESIPQAAKPTATPPADPLQKLTVASWWKLGGTAGGLEADQANCGTTLGEAHQVAPNAKVVTVGMLRCLKGRGWFAVGR
jgi:hypothetical protein